MLKIEEKFRHKIVIGKNFDQNRRLGFRDTLAFVFFVCSFSEIKSKETDYILIRNQYF